MLLIETKKYDTYAYIYAKMIYTQNKWWSYGVQSSGTRPAPGCKNHWEVGIPPPDAVVMTLGFGHN